jgi:hypothetical protein
MKGIAMAFLLALLAVARVQAQSAAAESKPAGQCAALEFRQLDFWIGDWDTYEITDSTKVVARNHVTSILGGCVLREDYQQNDGLLGESYSLWDSSRGVWHQSWVTNRGALLLLNGRMEGNRMVMTAAEKLADGTPALLRGMWWAQGRNVRHKAERSTDAGKTWKPVFDMVFRPHRPT